MGGELRLELLGPLAGVYDIDDPDRLLRLLLVIAYHAPPRL